MSTTLDSVTDMRSIAATREALHPDAAGAELHDRIRRLYPICRSITGDGVRQTLTILAEEIRLTVEEVATGTPAYDWSVPKEWNIRDAYIKDAAGVRIVDFGASNLHVVGYSAPVHAFLSLSELRPHLHSIPEHPDWIPYKTSYWSETWGFCLPDRLLQSLREGQYEVCIDSSLEPGHLTWGQCVLEGRETDEVLISCHICHPSLCNDNLSSISIAVTLARLLASIPRRYTYRFLFIPATIGAITWLSRHEDVVARIRHGLVLACLGDRGQSTYKRSRRGNALIDRAVAHVLQHSGAGFSIKDFSPYGYDERQYCSPGFNLPVGLLSRTPHGCFPEYHTSADNLECVDPHSLADSLVKILNVVEVLEGDRIYLNRSPKGEPQLGKRGLFGSMGGHGVGREVESALLWVLNFSDGEHSLLDIAERSGISFNAVGAAADALLRCELLAARTVDTDRAYNR
jgi:aminopeptidase-like protein